METVGTTMSEPQWLARRQRGIGASEVAPALGMSPYETPAELYLRKTGQLEPIEETIPMAVGKALENLVGDLYERETGHTITDRQVFLEGEREGVPIFATLDGVSYGGLVEIKTISDYKAKEIGEDGDELPVSWLLQAAQQMVLADADHVDFAILIGNHRFLTRTVRRNDDLIRVIYPRLAEFWGHVVARKPPAVDGESNARVYGLCYPDTGETFDGYDLCPDITRYEDLGAEIKALEEARDKAKAAILASLQGRTAVLPDNRRVRLQCVKGGKTVSYVSKDSYRLSITKGREK